MSRSARDRPAAWLVLRSSVLDRVAAALLALVLGPVIGILAVLVRRDDGAPSLVGLDRMGRGGTSFRMWKLRSMRVEGPDGSAGGAIITSGDGDDRITRFGAVLRRWRLDELPQVWNVLRGDMSLVGPRPEAPSLVDLGDPRWHDVLAVRPGISGPTQLVVERWETDVLTSGTQELRYAEDILPVKLAIDRWYVQHATLAVDARVAWSMVERFLLGRDVTSVERVVRAQVPEAQVVPGPQVADA